MQWSNQLSVEIRTNKNTMSRELINATRYWTKYYLCPTITNVGGCHKQKIKQINISILLNLYEILQLVQTSIL